MSPCSKTTGPVLATSVAGDAANSIRKFLVYLFPEGVEIIYAQENNVPVPAGDYILINVVGNSKKSSNRRTYGADGSVSLWTPYEASVQLDFFGDGGGDRFALFSALWFDDFAFDWFAQNDTVCRPLYCNDGIQTPFLNESDNFEQRWMANAFLQVNQTIVLEQPIAINPGKVAFVEVDTGLKNPTTGD